MSYKLAIKSDKFLEMDNTPFDFRSERLINTGTRSSHPQNVLAGEGCDHSFLLGTNHDSKIVLKDNESGRTLTIETDQAGVVVYLGNSLKSDGEFRSTPSRKYLGICLETQA